MKREEIIACLDDIENYIERRILLVWERKG